MQVDKTEIMHAHFQVKLMAMNNIGFFLVRSLTPLLKNLKNVRVNNKNYDRQKNLTTAYPKTAILKSSTKLTGVLELLLLANGLDYVSCKGRVLLEEQVPILLFNHFHHFAVYEH